jgi:mannose-6-phosphate isomerase-like protein (cupin superfamily)
MKVSLQEALARVPGAKGERFAVVFERGSVSVEVYAPRGTDPQSPHKRDELYIVAAGQGTFVCGERSDRFGPGDFLFVPAGVVHRFVDFTDDLVVWVVFYVSEGRDLPGVNQVLGREGRE